MQIKKTDNKKDYRKDRNMETKSRERKMYSKKHEREKYVERQEIGNETKEEIGDEKTRRKGRKLSFKLEKNRMKLNRKKK